MLVLPFRWKPRHSRALRAPHGPRCECAPSLRPTLWRDDLGVYPQDHPYVLRFWTPAVGPGAVADLLRLMTAARRGQTLREPLHLSELARVGLVRFAAGRVWVRGTVPPVSPRHSGAFPRRCVVSTAWSPGSYQLPRATPAVAGWASPDLLT